MSTQQATTAWIDGSFVPWDEARVHVRTDCVMRGGSVFEGIPGYWNEDAGQVFVFRLADHMDRLQRSMKVLRMQLDYSLDVLAESTVDLVRRNGFRQDVHLRPTVYYGLGDAFGYRPGEIEVGAFSTATPLPRHPTGAIDGLNVAISSWTRISDRDMPPRIKAAANYQNSRLAQTQAVSDGYDTAILLTAGGQVSETPAACVMMVRDGVLVTPRTTNGILESITRASIIELAGKELGLTVEQRDIDRTELYVADEMFECGSAHEVTPIVSVDRYPIGTGKIGTITHAVMDLYDQVVRGAMPAYEHWLTAAY